MFISSPLSVSLSSGSDESESRFPFIIEYRLLCQKHPLYLYVNGWGHRSQMLDEFIERNIIIRVFCFDFIETFIRNHALRKRDSMVDIFVSFHDVPVQWIAFETLMFLKDQRLIHKCQSDLEIVLSYVFGNLALSMRITPKSNGCYLVVLFGGQKL